MELTVQNVYGLLLRSRLMSLEEARAMFARWQEEAKDQATNLARFAAWMVANKYLTEYQASLLARGHAEGFFLGDYKILDRLGKGRMAGVYKAKYKLGQIVAIKVLPPSKAKEPTLLARFQREARLAVKLRHANIVRTFQMGVAGELNYLVMEYLDGETLEEVLTRRSRFAPPEAVRLIYQALQGLQHIHEQGLVHRDLKPANLMLVPAPKKDDTSGCTVKILDIGLGRGLIDTGTNPEPDPGLTGEGVLLGTPDYMAPEQARDPRATDIRADVYSLGCVLYHLLAGQPPFPDTNIISQMIKHATEQAKPLKEFNPAIPDGLQQIVNWMMAKDVAARYPTPSRAAQALEVYLMAGGAPPSSPDLDPDMQPYIRQVDEENARQAPLPATVPHVTVPAFKPPSGTIPTAAPVAQPVPAGKGPGNVPVAAAVAKEARGDGKSKKKKERGNKPPPPPVTAAEPSAFDVELVPVAPAKPSGLTRRDFVMFFAGVASVLVAIGLGRGLAYLLGRGKSKESDEGEK
jgi:serine/threonine protein kinase